MRTCISPIKKGEFQFACGKCYFCRIRKVDEWVLRIQNEVYRNTTTSVYFVTLTYNNENLPLSTNKLPTLSKEHVKKFVDALKKYNKRHGYAPVKYYLVGEYGTSKMLGRPHYHAIIFNVTSAERFVSTWKYGNVDIGHKVDSEAVGYIADYIYKEVKIPAFDRDDREKEFKLISNKIGDNYMTPEMIKYHRNHYFETRAQNPMTQKKMALPRYFQNKIFTEKERIERAAYIAIQIENHNILEEIEVELRTGKSYDLWIKEYIETKTELKKKKARDRKDL